MKKSMYVTILAFITFFSALTLAKASTVSSSFDVDSEGWSIVSFEWMNGHDYIVLSDKQAGYKKKGGYIFTHDPDEGDFTYQAPSQFLGNQIDKYGYTLSFDIMDYGSGSYYDTTDDIMLVGGGGERLFWKGNHKIDIESKDWNHVEVTLANSFNATEWQVSTNESEVLSIATQSDFFTVLSDLAGLYIRGEYVFGMKETGKLDNVQFGANIPVPEPASLLLLGAGMAVIAMLRRGASK